MRNVCFFSGLVKGSYIATNMYKQRNTLVCNNYRAKMFIPRMHQGILAQLLCFWNLGGMKPLKLFLGYIRTLLGGGLIAFTALFDLINGAH